MLSSNSNRMTTEKMCPNFHAGRGRRKTKKSPKKGYAVEMNTMKMMIMMMMVFFFHHFWHPTALGTYSSVHEKLQQNSLNWFVLIIELQPVKSYTAAHTHPHMYIHCAVASAIKHFLFFFFFLLDLSFCSFHTADYLNSDRIACHYFCLFDFCSSFASSSPSHCSLILSTPIALRSK